MTINKRVFTDYAIVAGLVAVSGFPYFMVAQRNILFLFLIAGFIFVKRSIRFDLRMLKIFLAFVVVELLQFLVFRPFDMVILSGTMIRLLLAYFVISIAGKKYTEYYVDIIYFFSGLGIVFFALCIGVPGFFNLFAHTIGPAYFDPPGAEKDGFYEIWPTIIIYCFHDVIMEEFRNPGPFWEPGLFSVYINVALVFNLMKEKKLVTRKNIVMIIALITTLSTAGYMAFFMVVFSFYIVSQSFAKKILISIITVPVILILYFSLDFLSNKIEENVSLAGTTTSSRFGSALADYNDFAESPIIGWGRGQMRYGGRQYQFMSEEQHRNNSVTDVLATYGIFMFFFYFYNYYVSLQQVCRYNNFNKDFAILGLIVILMCGFSQSIFLKPFFYSILFIHLEYTGRKAEKITQNSGENPQKTN